MTEYSKYNIVYRLQKWMDSVAGQTFLNYAYSWGASIVVLGALFKLTHLPGANLMLFIGMGTEVLVFAVSAFDRPFDKTLDGLDITPKHGDKKEENTALSGLNKEHVVETERTAVPVRQVQQTVPVDSPVHVINSVPSKDVLAAQNRYIGELGKLTDVLGKVGEQSSRLTRDSEEMENLNRTLTGITKVYEMQLKSASQQIGTIDQINEQSKLLAQHIEQLNKIYARMIEAMTINMRAAAPNQNSQL